MSLPFFIICARNVIRLVSLIVLFSLFGISSYAQKIEVGTWVGTAHYFGDLNTQLAFHLPGPAAGVFMRNNIGTRFSFKHSFIWGTIEGRDNLSKDPFFLQRNLSFKSQVFEISEIFEFNFLDFLNRNKKYWISPYIATGVAVFFFNPKTEYKGQWYDLQPLGTEGQNDPNYSGRKKYRLYNVAIPIGGGIKIAVSRHLSLGLDIQVRKTLTDYLDDVSTQYVSPVSLPDGDRGLSYALMDRSGEVGEKIGDPGYQRGTSYKFDDYLFMGVTASYVFGSQTCPKPYPERR